MFGLFKKRDNSFILHKVLEGHVMELADVPDAMFAQLCMGDGLAIEPESDTVIAPCDGEIILVAKTLHAVAIKPKNGLEVLIHIGLDTVYLNGEGFTSYVKVGDIVEKGHPLIHFDKEYIINAGKSLITPIVITNMDGKVQKIKKYLNQSDERLMEIWLNNN